ncbi:MAG: TlpA family protein disulfide reductase [Firmicutes bacterium]|nr:TlpA family protein disulfide reductase [Bacillota bacterium]
MMITLLAVAVFFIFAVAELRGLTMEAVVDRPAPDFTLPDLEGTPVSLGDYRGRVVLVNFWTTWCPPCKEEMPILQQLHREMNGRMKILAVDRAEPVEAVRRFVDKYGITFTVLLDRRDDLARRYQLTGIPESFFIDADGIIRVKWIGPMTLPMMKRFVQETEGASEGRKP